MDALQARAQAALDVSSASAVAARGRFRPAGASQEARRCTGAQAAPAAARPAISAGPACCRCTGYRIEKLVYETLPGVEVPAHLYLPEPCKPPCAAILFYNGHWWADSKTRPDFQAFCINAAQLGFVVLSFDPFGQGERGVSTRDHRRTELLLVGIAQQGLAEFETQCALDYLSVSAGGRQESDRHDGGVGRRIQYVDHRGAR